MWLHFRRISKVTLMHINARPFVKHLLTLLLLSRVQLFEPHMDHSVPGSPVLYSSHQVAKVLEFQLQHLSIQWIFSVDFLQDGLVWSPHSPRDSQILPPASQFEEINSSALSLFDCPALTSIQDYWKNHSFDYTDLCRRSNLSTF